VPTIHEFEPTRYHTTFGPHEAVWRVAPGDTILTDCVDAAGMDVSGDKVGLEALAGPDGACQALSNPVTGPFFIEGAEPGDTLLVHLEEVAPTRSWAWSSNPADFGFFSREEILGPTNFPLAGETDVDFRWQLDLETQVGRLELPNSRLPRAEIPLHPFLGCIGVAPERGESRITMTSGRHGGNMDCPQVRPGATLHLPVFVKGGLLCFGDCHAAQGDGELCGVALETPCRVRLTVELLKQTSQKWPRISDAQHVMAVGNARPLSAAFGIAHVELVQWLVEEWGFDHHEALQLVSQVGSARIGNIVDPNYSVVARFPRQYLP
jgi:amidase